LRLDDKFGFRIPSLRAQRSNPCRHKASLDCFVAALLAMTEKGDHRRTLKKSRSSVAASVSPTAE
jgi:hypothetical protein